MALNSIRLVVLAFCCTVGQVSCAENLWDAFAMFSDLESETHKGGKQ